MRGISNNFIEYDGITEAINIPIDKYSEEIISGNFLLEGDSKLIITRAYFQVTIFDKKIISLPGREYSVLVHLISHVKLLYVYENEFDRLLEKNIEDYLSILIPLKVEIIDIEEIDLETYITSAKVIQLDCGQGSYCYNILISLRVPL